MNLFSKRPRAVPQTYQPVLEAAEVIELFSRLTLHHQAAMVSMRPLASEPEA